MKKLLVTSALPYANGPIHIGHLVEYIQTDIWVRFWKLRGRDVIYLCADDTHGTPVMVRARDEGTSPEALIARVWQEHQRDFAAFDIEFDHYYTTHSSENRMLSTEIYKALLEGGHIAERMIEQAYCEHDAMFLPDRFVRGECPNCGAKEQYGDVCEVCSTTYTPQNLINPRCAQCGTRPTVRESVHLFFKLGDLAGKLRTWVEAHVGTEMKNKLDEWFEAGLKDWDISRDEPYFGFEIPDHPGKYFYVWLDAPVGYMACTMNYCQRTGRSFEQYWRSEESEVVHFIGKDIVYFHALFWPAMLMSSGFRTPTRLMVHGFLTVDGEKMSKSRGTFISAERYLKHLDPQYLRYYYAAKLSSAIADLDLNFEDFMHRVDADLVNKMVNIPSRVLAIVHKHCAGRLSLLDADGRALLAGMRQEAEAVASLYERREFSQVARKIEEMALLINIYLQEHKPWKAVKEDVIAASMVCTGAINAFRVLATCLLPILPGLGSKVAKMLRIRALTWSGIDETLEDCPVGVYERLVDRVDRSKVEALLAGA